jgi:hypothetical protein
VVLRDAQPDGHAGFRPARLIEPAARVRCGHGAVHRQHGRGIGGTQISSALHSASIKINTTIDKKRFMNGSNSRFAVAGYGVAERTIEAEFTFAKTDAIAGVSASELRNFLNGTA